MTQQIVDILNSFFEDTINTYKIPKDRFVMGGWSIGGLFSLRYTELANEKSQNAAIKPLAVFSCDGPCDLENEYYSFIKKHRKYPNFLEPTYGITELELYCSGNPQETKNIIRTILVIPIL